MNNLATDMMEFIQTHELCDENDRLLVAVSGGPDSMVLAHLLNEAGFNCGIAHFNFQLRKKESDKDEAFVKTYGQIWKIPFYSKRFKTKAYVKKHKLNLQEAARNLRYTWFSEIMEKHGFNKLVTAHHLDDQIETVMMNIARGAGIFGLQGMRPKRDHIIRPLLFASKDNILQFAKQNLILYRTDKSNANRKYRRNCIRHELIPAIENEIPAFKKRMHENIIIWQRSAQLLAGFIDQQIVEHEKVKDDSIVLEIDKIEESLRDLVTFEWLRPYGFNYSQIKQMIRCIDENQSGKEFYSRLNRLVVDRKKFILSTQPQISHEQITIADPDDVVHLPEGQIVIKLLSAPPRSLSQGSNVAHIDAQKVRFPLMLRRWRPGDFFHPLGMKKKKQKLKKFFANNKIDRVQKERIWLLCSDNEIVWIIDHRLDDRFKITKKTKYTLRITWTPND